MTIDTARCETCKGLKIVYGYGGANKAPCPDCTEPAPSAGVSAERLAKLVILAENAHSVTTPSFETLTDPDPYTDDTDCTEPAPSAETGLIAELRDAIKRGAWVESEDQRGCDGGDLNLTSLDDLLERVIRALLPKESDNGA